MTEAEATFVHAGPRVLRFWLGQDGPLIPQAVRMQPRHQECVAEYKHTHVVPPHRHWELLGLTCVPNADWCSPAERPDVVDEGLGELQVCIGTELIASAPIAALMDAYPGDGWRRAADRVDAAVMQELNYRTVSMTEFTQQIAELSEVWRRVVIDASRAHSAAGGWLRSSEIIEAGFELTLRREPLSPIRYSTPVQVLAHVTEHRRLGA